MAPVMLPLKLPPAVTLKVAAAPLLITLPVPFRALTLVMGVKAEVLVGPVAVNTPRPNCGLMLLPENAPVLCVVLPLLLLTRQQYRCRIA